jgi:O-antigen/teichoic acid export membrane protein
MMGELDMEEKIPEEKKLPLEESSGQEEESCKGLFFRVDRKRADYFADVGKIESDSQADTLSAQRYSAFLQSIGLSVSSLDTVPIKVPPTRQIAIAGQPTHLLPRIAGSFAHITSKTITAISITVGPAKESYGRYLGSLLRRSGVYALASMASPFVALALAPFLTHHLSRTDYGILAVLTTAIALMAGISQLGLGSAFFRVYNYDYEAASDRTKVLSTTLILLLCCLLPLTLTALIAAPWLAAFLLGRADLADLVRLATLVVLLQNLTVPSFAWLQAENRAGFFVLLSTVGLLTNLGMTFVLVGAFHLGIGGALLATGCSYILVLLCTLPPLLLRVGKFAVRLDIVRALLAFGLPNAVSFASAWILQLVDRFLLAHIRSLSETATYSVAYTLGSVLSIVVLSPFSLVWPSTLFLIARRQDARHIFRLIFRWYSLFLLFATYALSLVVLFVLNVFFPASYRSAADIIPLVALSTMFYGLYSYLMLGMNICKKLWYAVLFLTSAALLNIGANFVLIPLYGLLGAALATLMAYAVLALETYLLNQRIYPVPFEKGLFGLGLWLTIGCYQSGSLLAQGRPFWLAWSILLLFLLFCGIGLFALGRFWTLLHRVRYGRAPHSGLTARCRT